MQNNFLFSIILNLCSLAIRKAPDSIASFEEESPDNTEHHTS